MTEKAVDPTAVLVRIKSMFATPTTEHTDHTLDQTVEQQFKTVAIRRLTRKLDRRLLPFLVLSQMISFVDRANIGTHFSIQWPFFIDQIFIGHKKLMGIQKVLQMSRSERDWFMSMFSFWLRKTKFDLSML